jgi:hypothetical protein
LDVAPLRHSDVRVIQQHLFGEGAFFNSLPYQLLIAEAIGDARAFEF